jgi:hypothetical protein
VPHLVHDTVRSRIQRLLTAWPRFLKALNVRFREHGIRSVEWFRVVEWTPGHADLLGNPHLHLWVFSPYLDQGMLRDAWRAALLTAGCGSEACANPIVHIVAMKDPRAGALELIKYLTKDITAKGERLDPELYAEVYKALDGRRQTQASKGFMARANSAAPACECGSTLPRRVQRKARAERNSAEETTDV